jgi:hypothetical protein
LSISIGALHGTVSLDDRFSGALDMVMHRTDQFLSRMDSGFGRLALGVAGVAGAIAAAAGTISYMGVQGSKLNDLDKSFERLAGSVDNAQSIMAAMNEGVAETVDSTNLLEFANRALGSRAIRNAEEFRTVTTAARAYSRDGLGSIEQILGQVNVAMTTGNLRQIQTLTGRIDLTRAEVNYAKQLGGTADQLTSTQKKEAARLAILEALQEKVQATGALEQSYAERIRRTGLAISDWFDGINKRVAALPSLGRAFDAITSAISRNFGGTFTSMADTVVDLVDRFAKNVERYGPTVIDWIHSAWEGLTQIADTVQRAWNLLPDWLKKIAIEAAATGVALKLATGAVAEMGKVTIGSATSVAGNIGEAISGFKDLLSITKEFGGSLRDLVKAGFWGELLGWLARVEIAATGVAGAMAMTLGTAGAVVGGAAGYAFMNYGVLGGKGTKLAGTIADVLSPPKKPNDWRTIGALNIPGVGPDASGFLAGGTPDLSERIAPDQSKLDAALKQALDRAKSYWADYFEFVDKRTVGELERRENAIARWYDSEVDALRGLELAHKDYNTAVAALDSLRAEKLVDAMNTLPPLPSRSLNGNIRVGLVGPNPELPESFRPVPNIPNMRTGVEQTFSKVFASSFRELPNLLIDSFTGNGSWKGGVRALGVTFTNNLFGEEGAFSSVTQKLSGALGKGLGKVFGGSVGKALGEGISSFLPGIGAFLAPLAEAAIGKLRKLMGGPSEDELKGRKLVAQFEDTLAKSLTGIQRAEAGTDKWKQTTIGVREMYLKAGLSIEDARKATERLWAASKQGEEAVKAVIEQINKTRELADARTQLKDVEKQLAGQQLQNASAILAVIKGQQNGVALTGRELKDFGAIAVASFGAALKAGMSFAEALQQVGPGLADLQDALQRAGVASDDAFVGILARLGKIQQQNPTLVAGIGALGDSFVALNAMGRLTPATFESIERSGSSLYERLQAEVAGLGGSTEDALTLMQDYLHKAEKSARDLGIPLDANTQMLIDQSKELGIWQEAGKTATDILIDQMNELVDKIQDLVDAILGVPNINVGVNYNDPGAPGADPAPGGQNGLQPRYLNAGLVRMTPRGADIYPAMIRADERVLTPNQYRDTVAESFGRGMAAGGGANGETFIENVITIGDEVLARQIRKIQDRDVRMRRKVRGA